MSEILEFLTGNQVKMFKSLEELVRAESPSSRKDLVDRCGGVLARLFLEHLGLKAEKIYQPQVGNHLKFTYGVGEDQILLLGHMDTVWDEGRLPFWVEGDRAYGPGILDMKGGLVQAMWALKALRDLGLKVNKKIVFLVTSDEEIGSPSSRALLEAEARKSQAVLVVEPAVANTGAVKTARKGVGIFNLKVKGVAAHAGNHHDQGVSAIVELARQILFVQGLTDYQIGTTVNVGVVKGGTRSNVVPAMAEAEIDVRVSTLAEAKCLEDILRNLQSSLPGTSLQVTGGINRPPMERTPAIGELYKVARQIATELGFELPEAAVGGGSDGNFTAALGIPTLDGLGCVGDGPHAENEHILLVTMAQRAALLAHLLRQLAR